jgi:type I restriction enzyme S subunit
MSVIPAEQVDSADIEEPWPVPEGWTWTNLQEAAPINPPTAFDELADDAAIPFIPMAAVAEETGAMDFSQRRRVAEVSKGYVRFRKGDVIFAKITPCMENGKTAPVVGLEDTYIAGSTEFHVLRPRCLDTRYLWYWLVRRAFRSDAERNMSGPLVSFACLLAIYVCCPFRSRL